MTQNEKLLGCLDNIPFCFTNSNFKKCCDQIKTIEKISLVLARKKNGHKTRERLGRILCSDPDMNDRDLDQNDRNLDQNDSNAERNQGLSSILIICGFYVCKFAHSLKCFCNLQSMLVVFFQPLAFLGRGEKHIHCLEDVCAPS